jgi:hypothetical protein
VEGRCVALRATQLHSKSPMPLSAEGAILPCTLHPQPSTLLYLAFTTTRIHGWMQH